MYRDLKLRGAIIKDKDLIILPEEKLFNKIAGCFEWLNDALCSIAKDCFVKPCSEISILFVPAPGIVVQGIVDMHLMPVPHEYVITNMQACGI